VSHAGDIRLAEDAAARERALDVTRSFLVQAPAGSGKTELLIQRLLALLGRVERPERVLAITFTRKAAGEMRDRVIGALLAAQRDVDEAALRPHERLTRRLARDVLTQDERLGWHLTQHPSRLAIQTIDSLAQAIALQAPIASGLAPAPRFTEDAVPLYLDAARAAIAAARPDDGRWRTLLGHQDNDADALANLLAQMLAQRDQWLTRLTLAPGGEDAARRVLERTLAREVEGELAQCADVVAAADFAPVVRFAKLALPNLDESLGVLRASLERCVRRDGPPPLDVAHVADWGAIAEWLTTGTGNLRRNASSMPGIPAIGRGPGHEARRADAQAVADWLNALASVPGLADAFSIMRGLPPVRYSDGEWERIASMLSLLPELAARLATVFAEARELDFPQATLAALAALGTGDEPSDLLLRLDLRIDHVLVDEFQDTSYAHLELIGRLVAGWSDGDGRTIFAVGDPMQSIYRFRGAEVRAFVDAQASGAVEGIAVECLTLRRNFRSQARLVDWVNATFPRVLGAKHDPWRSRVAFADAVAVEQEAAGPACTVDTVADDEGEAKCVVARLREALEGPGNVALLVRARSHLARILPALRAASIPYSAVDLDSLGDRPAARDVAALAHAIAQPDDRLAWLALLRAPWCGLALADLHAMVVAADATPSRSIEAAVAAPPGTLSPDGAARLARLAGVLAHARDEHGLAPMSVRVRDAWTALGGPATLDEPLDLVAVDDVLALLAEHERAGDVPDWNAFVARLDAKRLSPLPGEEARVQVMTMHKAKGLEFDTVILPGLARPPARGEDPPLRWAVREQPDGGRTLLLAPLTARIGAASERDPVYAYLKALDLEQEDAEAGRLLYVGCTRAQRRLHLVAAPGVKAASAKAPCRWADPRRRSALACLWPGIGEAATAAAPPEPAVAAPDAGDPVPPPPLLRLPLDWTAPPMPPPLAVPVSFAAGERGPPFDWAQATAAAIGTVAHRLFGQMAQEGLAAWDAQRVDGARARVLAELAGEGVDAAACAAAADVVQDAVRHTCADARGRWLFAAGHLDARSEWALAGVEEGRVAHVTLDRTFIADGVRWIVDFKTGRHEGADPAQFLDRERERYRAQLERYARFVRALAPGDPVPIRLALYHPLVPDGWREWGYE